MTDKKKNGKQGKDALNEVVLRRCWLAPYWSLAAHNGICADIVVSKYEHWSSLAPLSFEVVISAGQTAKEESKDVERGLTELRKLGIEQKLWEASRKKIGDASIANGKHTESEALT